MSKKQDFLNTLNMDHPTWIGNPWNCFKCGPDAMAPIVDDPITAMDGTVKGSTYQDMWGVTYHFGENDPGATPIITEANKVVKDITKWQDYIKFPKISNLDWEPFKAAIADIDRDEYLVMAPTWPGMFEFSHLMLGFEDSLCYFIEEPEAMFEMLSAYTDWKLEAVKLLIDNLKPDIIHSHDDWGTKKDMFLSPGLWREGVKPHFKRLYEYIKSRGVLIQHHSDSVHDAIAEDMVELGIDMWQGCIPQNDIKGVVERTKGKLCLMGGIDMQIVDRPDWTEESIRKEVRRAIDTYAPLGHFMPCIANIWAIYPEVGAVLNEEMENYGKEWIEKHGDKTNR